MAALTKIRPPLDPWAPCELAVNLLCLAAGFPEFPVLVRERGMTMVRTLACIVLGVSLASLSGCSAGSASMDSRIATAAARTASGSVYGGQNPVSGATIQLWAVGTTGYGSAATPLIGATLTTSDGTGVVNSNANAGNANNTLSAGSFTISGDYICPTASTLVYLTAIGGNPGLGGTVNNSAIVMLAALGQCGTLNSATFISINEVITAGSIEVLSSFMSGGGSIGSPSDAVSLQAIANAFAEVSKVVNTSTGGALNGFPKLNTLANAVVPCVNSTGATSSNCVSLFTDATPSGGTAPTTVLGAILDVALNPTLNGTAIYNLSTANAPFQPALTSAPVLWNITTGGAAVSACGTSGGGDNVSGTVSYSGTKTGRIYLALINNNGCDSGTEGTSIASPGAFTIHGVPPGNYTLQAFMDTQGYGALNAADPTGVTGTIGIGVANGSGANVTLTDPATVTVTTTPGPMWVAATNNGVAVQYQAVKNSNGTETATSYTLQWSTSSSFASLAGNKTFPANGDGVDVWLVNGLTNGTVYYFRASGSSAGTATGPYSAVYGPVTIGPPTSGSTVSGAISFTGTATGPLYVGFYNQDNDTVPVYVQAIASPVSAQAFSLAVPNSASAVYIPFGVIDQNNNGIIDAGDITNVLYQGGPIAVTGAIANQNLTLPSGNAIARVTTQAIQSGSSTRYGLFFELTYERKLPVAVTMLNSYNADGASIDNGPLDIASCAVAQTNCGDGNQGFQIYFNFNSTAPTTGDTYLFNVTYSDGTSETIPVAISNVLTAFATNLAPQTGGSTSTTPTLTWTDPVCGACSTYTYAVYVNDPSGNQVWYVPNNGALVPGTTSVTWGVDPTDSTNIPPSLTLGTNYSWSVTVQDSNYNQATTVVNYQP
jgi:hypothetical protein